MKKRKMLEINFRVFGLFQASLKHEQELENGCATDSDVVEGEYDEIPGSEKFLEQGVEIVPSPVAKRSTHKT